MTWEDYQDALQLTNPQLAQPGKMRLERGVFLDCLRRAYNRGRDDQLAEMHSDQSDHSAGNGAFDYLKRKFGL